MNIQKDEIDELVTRAWRDLEAFGELYTLFQSRIYSYVARRIPNRTDAEDVTGQVFLKVLTGIKSFDPRPERGEPGTRGRTGVRDMRPRLARRGRGGRLHGRTAAVRTEFTAP